MCDHDSTVVRATRLVTREGDIAQKAACASPVRSSLQPAPLPPGQDLNFGSLAYVVDYSGELHPLKEIMLGVNESLASYPLLGLLGADHEVLARQIRLGLVPNPTVSECRNMFYMLENIHHQITAGEVLLLPHRF